MKAQTLAEENARLKGELQRELNPLIAKLRNEYATQKLQSDFREGLEELCHGPDEEEREEGAPTQASPASKPMPELQV